MVKCVCVRLNCNDADHRVLRYTICGVLENEARCDSMDKEMDKIALVLRYVKQEKPQSKTTEKNEMDR